MNFARALSAAAGCLVVGATVAACSGSFGSGTGLPNPLASPNFGNGPASPTPPPKEASSILTYGESTAFQPLPEVGGYGGSIAFPKAAEPTAPPSPKSKGKNATPEPAPTAVAVSIGATLSTVKPQDGPDLNFEGGKGKRKKSREHPARALAYITLLPTHDVTLESYPRITLDVPREIASQYRDGEFGLALWNSGEKDSKYRLAVAELDTGATPPPARQAASASTPAAAGTTGPKAAATPATMMSTLRPGTSPAPGASGVVGIGAGAGGIAPTVAPTLPPERLLFAGTATPLKLVANRPAIFALYALPHHAASPEPKSSGTPAPKPSGAPASAAPSPASASTKSP